ncbi:N-hydroxyarylamine O-acetyltransferase [Paenibacillus baekrokdamisoli]|uniref:N-hydroxyarylamine O-acetyltransferase n=1 Tax=Paenibacillus baekrokdamisoli TaxID=1712516 RepID=A0A3G9IL61_9BACL|nr:arylamine N-acetyltransferase [Paenibacillus baekrokdamisoli]MBB3072648.1 N-hydroxyarylamine O-acetyltransferase [Paenibacillus baekrokdamisoli]BBH18932.1 N-hydroxyarylamine O-acetyltransferase [Paenibacillus baekrokdamisoli]
MTNNLKDVSPEIEAYLKRIGFEGKLDGSAAALAALQERHLHAIPYENLDIYHGIPLSLEIEALYEKIVLRRRGGYCFELNALFGWLLRELGYEVTDYVARFWRDETNTPPKRRHHVLKVQAGEKVFLCDVGVGGIVPRRPIEMAALLEQPQGDECYRLERDASFGWFLCERKKGQWTRIYSFTEEPQLAKDYTMASFWCEHAPDSIFKQDIMLAIRTQEGRNTAAGREFRIFTSEGVRSFVPETTEAYNEALYTYFGIQMDLT